MWVREERKTLQWKDGKVKGNRFRLKETVRGVGGSQEQDVG